MDDLLGRLEALERRCERAESAVQELLEQKEAAQRAVRGARRQRALAVAAIVGAVLISPGNRAALAQAGASLVQRVTALESAVSAVQTKTQYVSVSGGEMFIDGTNLHIRNGLGASNGDPSMPINSPNATTNGKGNLILGYNASRVPDGMGGPDVRTGSHCLIVGDRNNYSSFGGIVVGDLNTISNAYASISGGFGGIVNGARASVSGGSGNTASGSVAWVAGGFGNMATNSGAAVSGGNNNVSSGLASSVSGGSNRTASGSFDWVAGTLFQDN
jgi:hypothetical protein